MPGFREINADLDRITREIETKSGELETAREAYLTAKANYDNTLAAAQLEAKMMNLELTQTDVRAQATKDAHNSRLDLIKAECTYKRLMNEIRARRDRLDACREMSFNLRQESKI